MKKRQLKKAMKKAVRHVEAGLRGDRKRPAKLTAREQAIVKRRSGS